MPGFYHRGVTPRRLRTAFSLVVLAAVLATSCASGGAAPGDDGGGDGSLLPATAEALPSFDLAAYHAVLAELRGRPVLVNIWASWCGPCRDEAPHLRAGHEGYGDRVQFLGVDILDAREDARAFMREVGWTYPSVFDVTGAIRDGLGLVGQPVTLFYDAAGELVDTWIGPLTRQALRTRLESLVAA
jgi:cytochrome c biogenesis protein CcmG/thiol:disulfide interchange protein DsbE